MIRGLTRGAATHSQRLEKWLGREETERLSAQFRNFYYPVPVAGVPGRVYVMPGGDFAGPVEAGQECSALDRADDIARRYQRTMTRYRLAQMFPRQRGAFGDLQSLLQSRGGGKACFMFFFGSNSVNGSNKWGTTWTSGTQTLPAQPTADAPAAPGGAAPTSATTGALKFVNNGAANTSIFIGARYQPSGQSEGSIILYDRLFHVAKTMNSTATEAVTGVPTRYTNQTSTAEDYIGGNFLFPEVGSVSLAATAHNWTVCQYTNQAGTTGQSAPSATGLASATGVDLATATSWFMPLASGDVGVKALTQMQCSALVATGKINFVIGHIIAALPFSLVDPASNQGMLFSLDGINTAFNCVRIFDNACLTMMIGAASPAGLISANFVTVAE